MCANGERPQGREPGPKLMCNFCKNYDGVESRIKGHMKDSHHAKKLKSRINGGEKPVKCIVPTCKFEPKGRAVLLSDHLKDPTQHEPEDLLEVGYEVWFIYDNYTEESIRIIAWLLTRGFIIEKPSNKQKKPAQLPFGKGCVESLKKRLMKEAGKDEALAIKNKKKQLLNKVDGLRKGNYILRQKK